MRTKFAICCAFSLINLMGFSQGKTFATTPLFTDPDMLKYLWILPSNNSFTQCKITVTDSTWNSNHTADAKKTTETIEVMYDSGTPEKLQYVFKSKKSGLMSSVEYKIGNDYVYIHEPSFPESCNIKRQDASGKNTYHAVWNDKDTNGVPLGRMWTVKNTLGIDSLVIREFDGKTTRSELTVCRETSKNRFECIWKKETGVFDTSFITLDSLGRIILKEIWLAGTWYARESYGFDNKGLMISYALEINPLLDPEGMYGRLTVTRDSAGNPTQIAYRTSSTSFFYAIEWL